MFNADGNTSALSEHRTQGAKDSISIQGFSFFNIHNLDEGSERQNPGEKGSGVLFYRRKKEDLIFD